MGRRVKTRVYATTEDYRAGIQMQEYRDSKGVLLHQWDKVEVVEGVHKGKRGTITHIEGGRLFVYCGEEALGFFVPSVLRRVFVHRVFGETEVILLPDPYVNGVSDCDQIYAYPSWQMFREDYKDSGEEPIVRFVEQETVTAAYAEHSNIETIKGLQDKVVAEIKRVFALSPVERVYVREDLTFRADGDPQNDTVTFSVYARYAFLRKKQDAPIPSAD